MEMVIGVKISLILMLAAFATPINLTAKFSDNQGELMFTLEWKDYPENKKITFIDKKQEFTKVLPNELYAKLVKIGSRINYDLYTNEKYFSDINDNSVIKVKLCNEKHQIDVSHYFDPESVSEILIQDLRGQVSNNEIHDFLQTENSFKLFYHIIFTVYYMVKD